MPQKEYEQLAFYNYYLYRKSLKSKLLSRNTENSLITILDKCFISSLCLQCFDAVGWAAGRASGL